mgnify:CR=1 FL=1
MALFTKACFKYSDIFEGICFALLFIFLLLSKLLFEPAFGIFCLILFVVTFTLAIALGYILRETPPKELRLWTKVDKLLDQTLSVMIMFFMLTITTAVSVLIEIIWG